MSHTDLPATFAALAAELLAEPDEAVTARAIVDRMADLVPDVEEVSLTVRTRQDHATLASTGELALQADALQYALGEGPCIESAAGGDSRQGADGRPGPVPWSVSGDIRSDGRWPRWSARAAELGVRSLLSVALIGGGRTRGALNLYSTRAGAFSDRDTVDLAVVYATHATSALTSARLVGNLQTAMASRHSIGMAQGILMERFGLDEHRSFELLSRLSSSTETKLRDVAAQIVETGRVPGTTPLA